MVQASRISSRILDRYILGGEKIVVATRHHWAKMIEPVATVLVAFLVISLISDPIERASSSTAVAVLWWIFLALVARLLWRILEWRNEWFVATDKRLLMTYGLITHKVAMMPLRKVTDLNYSRSPIGRVLGYGEFLLESAGQDQAMREIDWLPQPDQTYRSIVETIFGPAGRDPDEDGPDPWPSVPAATTAATVDAPTVDARADADPPVIEPEPEPESHPVPWDPDWSAHDDADGAWEVSREDSGGPTSTGRSGSPSDE